MNLRFKKWGFETVHHIQLMFPLVAQWLLCSKGMEGMYGAGPNSGVILKLEWLLCFYAPGFCCHHVSNTARWFCHSGAKGSFTWGPVRCPPWHEYTIHAEWSAGWYLPGLAACFRIQYKNGRSLPPAQFRKFNEIRNEGCGMIGKAAPCVSWRIRTPVWLLMFKARYWPGSYHQMNNGLCRYARLMNAGCKEASSSKLFHPADIGINGFILRRCQLLGNEEEPRMLVHNPGPAKLSLQSWLNDWLSGGKWSHRHHIRQTILCREKAQEYLFRAPIGAAVLYFQCTSFDRWQDLMAYRSLRPLSLRGTRCSSRWPGFVIRVFQHHILYPCNHRHYFAHLIGGVGAQHGEIPRWKLTSPRSNASITCLKSVTRNFAGWRLLSSLISSSRPSTIPWLPALNSSDPGRAFPVMVSRL